MKAYKNENIELIELSNSKIKVNINDENCYIVKRMVQDENGEWGVKPDNSDHFIKAEFVATFKNVLNQYWKIIKVSDEDKKYIDEKLLVGSDDIFNQETFEVANVYYGYSNLVCENKSYNFKIRGKK